MNYNPNNKNNEGTFTELASAIKARIQFFFSFYKTTIPYKILKVLWTIIFTPYLIAESIVEFVVMTSLYAAGFILGKVPVLGVIFALIMALLCWIFTYFFMFLFTFSILIDIKFFLNEKYQLNKNKKTTDQNENNLEVCAEEIEKLEFQLRIAENMKSLFEGLQQKEEEEEEKNWQEFLNIKPYVANYFKLFNDTEIIIDETSCTVEAKHRDKTLEDCIDFYYLLAEFLPERKIFDTRAELESAIKKAEKSRGESIMASFSFKL